MRSDCEWSWGDSFGIRPVLEESNCLAMNNDPKNSSGDNGTPECEFNREVAVNGMEKTVITWSHLGATMKNIAPSGSNNTPSHVISISGLLPPR